MIRLWIPLIFVMMMPTSCSRKQTKTEAREATADESAVTLTEVRESYYDPLEIGFERHYVKMIAGPGSQVRKYNVSYRIDEMVEIDGRQYYKQEVDHSEIPEMDDAVYYEREQEDGRYSISGRDDTRTEYFGMPIPLEVGSKWQSDVPGVGIVKHEAVGLETLTLLGVTYEDCIKVSANGDDWSGYTWYARGIGDVKSSNSNGTYVFTTIMKPLKEREASGTKEKTAAGTSPTAVE